MPGTDFAFENRPGSIFHQSIQVSVDISSLLGILWNNLDSNIFDSIDFDFDDCSCLAETLELLVPEASLISIIILTDDILDSCLSDTTRKASEGAKRKQNSLCFLEFAVFLEREITINLILLSRQISRWLVIDRHRHSENHGTSHQELDINLFDLKLLEQL